MKTEGIYLLRKSEFINSNELIYKIGRSNNLTKRIGNYPNGSIVYLMIECENSKIHEAKLIKLFGTEYTNKLFYGKEFFEGSVKEMKKHIIDYVGSIMKYRGYQICCDEILHRPKRKMRLF
jgi:hypothetical protein